MLIDCVFKMHFHTNTIDDLYEFVPREILPEEYGGNAGKLDDLKERFLMETLQKRYEKSNILENFILIEYSGIISI